MHFNFQGRHTRGYKHKQKYTTPIKTDPTVITYVPENTWRNPCSVCSSPRSCSFRIKMPSKLWNYQEKTTAVVFYTP